MSTIRSYRCTHVVEALPWKDTDENRALFDDWFKRHSAAFSTRGSLVVLPDGDEVKEGEWVLWSHAEFIGLEDEIFRAEYTEAG